jgi:hypothetical protein
MISNDKNTLLHPSRTGPGSPNLVELGLEYELIRFCLLGHREKILATISDVTDYLSQKSITVDRWWVARFVECHAAKLTVQKALFLERLRHEIAPDDVKKYFNILREECRSIPSLFVWNLDETQIGSLKEQRH